jgi:hypothetical protein
MPGATAPLPYRSLRYNIVFSTGAALPLPNSCIFKLIDSQLVKCLFCNKEFHPCVYEIPVTGPYPWLG